MTTQGVRGQHFNCEFTVGWEDRALIHLPDGSMLTIETDPEKGVTYVLATTSLGHRVPLVEVMGDVGTLPDASVHPITGELINKHGNASALRVVFRGGKTQAKAVPERG